MFLVRVCDIAMGDLCTMSKVVISTAMPLDAKVAQQLILEVRVFDWTEEVPAVIAHRLMGYNASREFNVGGEFQLYLECHWPDEADMPNVLVISSWDNDKERVKISRDGKVVKELERGKYSALDLSKSKLWVIGSKRL